MKITLFEAAEELRHVLDQVDAETGELPEGFESARGLVANKASKVGAYILQSEAEAAMVETHAKGLLDRVKQHRRRVEWLKQYLLQNMVETGITEIAVEHGSKIKLYPFRDPAVEVFDHRQIPAEYFVELEPEISKAKIKAAIESGTEVPGAQIVKRHRLSIK
jgi:hypothetical protein